MIKGSYLKSFANYKGLFVFIFFFFLLLIGLRIYKDYGVHWDEPNNQSFGNRWYSFVSDPSYRRSFDKVKIQSHDLVHGPFFEVLLVFLQKNVFKQNSSRDIILNRHLCNFLLFYLGVCFFYLLCQFHFKDWRIALLSCSFLVFSPRIFADAFYNTVDLAFLSVFIIAMYTMLRWCEMRSFSVAAAHAFVCAILIDIKLVGILVLFFTFIFYWVDLKKSSTVRSPIRAAGVFMFYVVLLPLLIFLFWPLLWRDTFMNLRSVFVHLRTFSNGSPRLFLGKVLDNSNKPWYFAPLWIIITTPLFYFFCFLCGFIDQLVSLFQRPRGWTFSKRNVLIFLAWLAVPLLFGPGKLYNGWRHLFFIYPAFLIFAASGWLVLWRYSGGVFKGGFRNTLRWTLVAATVLSFMNTAYFMVRNHPYQNVYFNALAGRDMEEVKGKFELDYWGLAYRQGLEYILEHDKREHIRICVESWPGTVSLAILPKKEARRLVLSDLFHSDYYISNYLTHPQEYSIFEMNYWWGCYWIALQDTLNKHREGSSHVYTFTTQKELPPGIPATTIYTIAPYEASRFVKDVKRHPQKYFVKNDFYSIKVGNAKILVVYKITKDNFQKDQFRVEK